MIGQRTVINTLESLANNGLPNFIILNGLKGSGKRTVIKTALQSIYKDKLVFVTDTTADNIKSIPEMLQTQSNLVVVIPDVDDLSEVSKNALLKITEEMPHNNKMIITVSNITRIPDTLISRAHCITMDTYSRDEKLSYAKRINPTIPSGDLELIADFSETMQDVETLIKEDIRKFYDFVHAVIDNIADVQGSNALKITNSIMEMYDVVLFLRAFNYICLSRMTSNIPDERYKYLEGAKITTRYLNEITFNSYNKTIIIDNWILDIRKCWR